MKNSLKILLAAGVLCTAGLTGTVPASAQPNSFSFRAGDVQFGYRDGYYDHGRQWHSWRDARERNWYRARYAHSYRAMRHDRDHDRFDRDRDRDNDGVPN